MEDFKIVVFIMAILISLTAIANKRKLPYPVLLVVVPCTENKKATPAPADNRFGVTISIQN